MQVMLSRQGFSPGLIDGKPGRNTERALAAFLSARKLEKPQPDDCAAWQGLAGEGFSATTSYTVTAEDVAGPFVTVPEELSQQAALPELGYESALEKIAERFHTSPAFLEERNPGVTVQAGGVLTVPNVEPFDPETKPAPATAPAKMRLEVTKEGLLTVYSADGAVVFTAPVSSGSRHDPLPTGTWKVNGIGWRPKFHYNPALFWDAEATDTKATIPPGPNNPVGVVWIDINVPHYGIHGTPEPSRIGYAQSHGCVRLTNWDAARVASLVGANTPVIFK